MARGEGFPLTGREVVLTPPLTEAQMRALKVGDVVLIAGEMFTGRDNVHAYLMKNPPPVDLNGAALYHCGPVMLQEGGEWKVKAAGQADPRTRPAHLEVNRSTGKSVEAGSPEASPLISTKRRALGTHPSKYGIAKAPPLLGVPGPTPPGRFQGRALILSLHPIAPARNA